VRDRTQALKRSHVVELINLAAAWLGAMPAPFQAMLGQLGNRVPIAPFHLVCTNVPGSRVPLYLLGREMLRSYPYVPIGNQMGFCCAVQSYNGRVYFGLTADSEGVPDADRLRDFINESFEELCAAAGMVAKPAKKARRGAPGRRPASRRRRNASAPEAPPKPASEVETPAEAPTPSATQVEVEEARPAAKPRRRRARPQPVASVPEQAVAEPEAPAPEVPAAVDANFETSEDVTAEPVFVG
jgi:hypothetical protein